MSKKEFAVFSGAMESRGAYLISRMIEEKKGKHLILTASESRARTLSEDLSFFLQREVRAVPGEDSVFLNFEARNHDALLERLRAISVLQNDPDAVIVAPVSAALKPMMPHTVFEKSEICLSFGQEVETKTLVERIRRLGYERRSMVEEPGEFSIRGGILDIFAPDSKDPYRVEFFDTEVDSIRTFNLETQRSIENRKEIVIRPAQQMLADDKMFHHAAEKIRELYTRQSEKLIRAGKTDAAENLKKRRDELCEYVENVSNIQLLENYIHYFYPDTEYLWDYLGQGTLTVEDPDRISEFLDTREKEIRQDLDVMLERGEIVPEDYVLIKGEKDFLKAYEIRPLLVLIPFPKVLKNLSKPDVQTDFQSRPMMNFNGHLDLLEHEIREDLSRGYEVTLVSSSKERLESLRELAVNQGISGRLSFREGFLSSGLDFPEQKISFITDSNIFGTRKQGRRRRKKSNLGQQLESFTDLKAGDYVVHENHGIGKFLGVVPLMVQGKKKDYLKIKYAGSDLLYVPVEQFDIVQKYIGAEGKTPKINKLSGTEWKQTKARAKAAIEDMTDELVRLYAEREMEDGYAFGPDTVWQAEFEDSFPYEETNDQLRAIREIKEDMEKPEPMDRLLCGDVGFGKTEVAARAIFKCLAEGKQAALLVPTTLLANQHYYTLRSRFERFPFRVEMLSRFRTEEEQKDILAGVKSGDVDLLIGTHRILSSDVKFKDLGLLVIDEEQRFGVKHKEKIKELKKNIDVLTLSATPIPRTLNMSLTGIKKMSVIEEPPEERYPVQTYVMEESDAMIREVILREMDRGGQTFVVYNRVNGIGQVAEKIQQLVPDARIAVGHGRMKEQNLENIMMDFIDGAYDVLVATTIIESGIDIPNANTLIVLNADHFGLSQLYQLRGRVGRSNRIAYAYLMYRKDKVLTETSQKRLQAIREFTEFGSGFKIAMRDLQIRGAGNLLGSQQSGQMMAIGYELYCKMVNEQVRKLKGEIPKEKPEETKIELSVAANIPDWYIDDETLKIETYKKIADTLTEEQENDLLDELTDRYGDVPKETRNLIKISRIRSLAEEVSVSRITEENGKIVFYFESPDVITPEGIFLINESFGSGALVHLGVKPYIRIPLKASKKLDDALLVLGFVKKGRTSGRKQFTKKESVIK